MVEGVSGIVEGLNPKLIRIKLDAFTHASVAKPVKQTSKAAAQEPSQPGTVQADAKA